MSRISNRRRFLSGTARALVVLVTLGLLPMPAAAAAVLNALLERNSVTLGESVRLVLETDGRGADSIDLAPLERDFDVLSSSRSTQVQITNGRQSVSTRWIIELLPRRAGRLTVPSLDVDGVASKPLTLEVAPASAAGARPGAELFMEAEVDPGRHYVQGELLYRVRLYTALPILGGAIGPPEVAQATVQRIGDDVNFTAMRNGRRYDVVERRYAIFPQRSGKLRIGSARFSGQVGSGGNNMSAMERLLNRGRNTTLLSPPVSVDVLPPAPGFSSSDWLPARDLQLDESWPDGQREVRVGEPVTRVLSLVAHGLTASQLQLPTVAGIDGSRLYPDQPQRDDADDGEWVIGSVEQRIAMIPTRPGELRLPEVRLRWWDVDSDRERVAVLPARTLQVLPAAPAGIAISGGTDVAPGTALATPANDIGRTSRNPSVWPAIAGLLALLWLTTLVAWWRARSAPRPALAANPARNPASLAGVRRAVLHACARNDAAAARAALLEFARVAWPARPPNGLAALAERLGDAELAAEFERLNRVLYGVGAQPWSGERLRTRIRPYLAPPAAAGEAASDPLPPLNPPAHGSLRA